MKKTALLFVLIASAVAGKAQNLVPNGDFEQYSNCPYSWSQIDYALPWNTASLGDPDYYNQCDATAMFGVPVNEKGYQYAHSGEGYAGLHRYWLSSTIPEYREYIEIPLSAPLAAGSCYYFEMYINLSNESQFTSDDIGAYFSNILINSPTQLALPFTPQINNATGNNPDTLSWTLVSGNYTAQGGESYLTIGNFKDNASTSVTYVNSAGIYDESYVFIDDVLLTPCTGIQEQNSNEAITIYPNPVKDELHVQSSKFKVGDQIKIYDVIGKEIYRNQLQTSNFKLQTSNYLPGIYFIEINTEKESYRKKFIKE